MRTDRRFGFTLIELLVVIAIIGLLMAIIMPALGKAKEIAQRVICRSNIKQQCLGVMLYADDNDTEVPRANGGGWLWDVSFWTTNQVSAYAGITENDVYFCPANRIKKAEDGRMWQFSWVGSSSSPHGSPPFTSELPLLDESGLTVSDQRFYYRVMPNLWMFYKNDDATPPNLLSGDNTRWITKLSDLKSSSTTIMIMDNVIESAIEPQNFFEIPDGGLNTWGVYDNSNHASKQSFPGTSYIMPSGANTGYADGHVSWRDFEDMERQVKTGPYFWW